ncbi:hypothetical protein AVEN_139557-1 [Araneus ventricosus]|uniref:Uncharacterized protein n=1 Tax=Araneus ventricosus TaxID=182803 RepID=A0A4Y2PFT6_ARAVE|nr:hypothetical protein AVEN_34917-1 [Araneus ventricosus]GBN48876.1 hypothetical protein AVEN_139557-1 [Araneus ventricosus]
MLPNSLVIFTSPFAATKGLFWNNHIILNHGQMTPGLSTPLQTSAARKRAESGFEPGALRPRGRGLTTSPPRPRYEVGNCIARRAVIFFRIVFKVATKVRSIMFWSMKFLTNMLLRLSFL